jgi:hypothetical protein
MDQLLIAEYFWESCLRRLQDSTALQHVAAPQPI